MRFLLVHGMRLQRDVMRVSDMGYSFLERAHGLLFPSLNIAESVCASVGRMAGSALAPLN